MNTRAIDYVTEDFYESLSFQDGEQPDLETVKELFHGSGILINNSFATPVEFTMKSFIQAIESQVAEGNLQQFMQRELYSKTEIFGKVAQRISVYEYTLSDQEIKNLPRGINYIQYIMVDDHWYINSMVWCDENENYQVPEEYLS